MKATATRTKQSYPKALTEIRSEFEKNLPQGFQYSWTIVEYIDRLKGKTPPGVLDKHFKVFETNGSCFLALCHAASEVTKDSKFKPVDIITAIEDWLIDKQFISGGGAAESFCGHLWLLVAVNGALKSGTSVKFLDYLATAPDLKEWRGQWVAKAALKQREQNNHLTHSDRSPLSPDQGYEKPITGDPNLYTRYHLRGGYEHSKASHRALVSLKR
jgi:hypothetical protein